MMLRIDVTCGTREYTFRSNPDGSYLFVGVHCNEQIRCDSGFRSLRRIKKAIRNHLSRWGELRLPRLTYKPSPCADWLP